MNAYDEWEMAVGAATSWAMGGLQERDHLAEARAILTGTSALLPEKAHLEALEEFYQCEIIRIVHDIEQVTKATLRRN